MRTLSWALVALLAIALPARADIQPHPLVSSGMVLQRGVACPLWGTASPGEKITWTLTQPDKPLAGEATADDAGAWKITLPVVEKAGGPFRLTLTGKNKVTLNDVYIGEVWLASGQSNMEWQMAWIGANADIKASQDPKVRMFTVAKATAHDPRASVTGSWQAASPKTTGGFSAVGYYFARDLSKALGVPVGIIHSSWGGTVAEAWVSPKKLESYPSLKYLAQQAAADRKGRLSAVDDYLNRLEAYVKAARKARSEGKDLPPQPTPPGGPGPNTPAVLYNAMIHPLLPYAIKGAIWYQGESNALSNRSYEYQTLFPALIEDWREVWKNPEMPFLFVQLAPWRAITKEPMESNWAELCEAQRLTSLKVKNTGMAVINDVGDPGDIHPRKKEPVGGRLALAARAIAYGEKVEHTGPVYDKIEVKDGKAVVTFKNVGKGLEAKGGELTGFTIAGKDRKWRNARAEIKGDTVVVWSEDVKEPVAVRFGWSNCPVVNLWNKDGLPASAFRTDNFPLTTQPKSKQ